METNRVQRLANQYPENWCAKVAADILCKIIEGKGKPILVRRGRQLIHQSFEHKIEHKCILDLNINVLEDRDVTCTWYQKPTDAGLVLNYRTYAPTQYKRMVIQGHVHRIFLLVHLTGSN